jgi:hypothetical protein
MAATLFRREALQKVSFRWEPGRCECQSCCDDLRSAGMGIGYLPGALAWHRPDARALSDRLSGALATPSEIKDAGSPRPGRILSAFNKRDYQRFRSYFLKTLRASGNREYVTAVVYGLNAGEQALLAVEPRVEVVSFPENGVSPSRRRLSDFQDVISLWPEDTPVAYYDSGDVLFQDRLEPLWQLVRANPGVLLVAPEPQSYPDNPVIQSWSDQIVDPNARLQAFEIMSTHTFLNGGFVAGTPSALLRYLRASDHLLNSSALHGVGDWGDQPALNLYSHTHPHDWMAVSPAWNYTLAGRDPRDYRVGPKGRMERSNGERISVVHGNAACFSWNELFWSCVSHSRSPAI